MFFQTSARLLVLGCWRRTLALLALAQDFQFHVEILSLVVVQLPNVLFRDVLLGLARELLVLKMHKACRRKCVVAWRGLPIQPGLVCMCTVLELRSVEVGANAMRICACMFR